MTKEKINGLKINRLVMETETKELMREDISRLNNLLI